MTKATRERLMYLLDIARATGSLFTLVQVSHPDARAVAVVILGVCSIARAVLARRESRAPEDPQLDRGRLPAGERPGATPSGDESLLAPPTQSPVGA
jgi:hypothetical protein